ncbi:MAG: ABC transporter ATP-binding protein [Ardenticatenales bacterium]|nr:ABC transporter ATP-binding protein [Ardenticatenales bacterium]
MIEAEQLTKQFDEFVAVRDLSLQVAEGEVLALLGHNGAGKTTTIRCLSAILEPTRGWARIAGYDTVQEPRTVRRLVGLLTEFPGLYDRMAPHEYLKFFGSMHSMSSSLIEERTERLLKHFDLWRVRDQRIGQYSKGMRQKMALVRALLHEPPILFLDEPTSALDPQSAKQVRDYITGLRSEGRTIILCTHNLVEAETLADRIAIIARGEIQAIGTSDSLKRDLLGPPIMEVRLTEPLNGALTTLEQGLKIIAHGNDWFRFEAPDPTTTNPLLLRQLDGMGHSVLTLSEVPRSLETLYLRIADQVGQGESSQEGTHDAAGH